MYRQCFLNQGKKVIIGANGFFGERLNTIAHYYGLDTIVVAGEWGKELNPKDISKAIEENPDAVGVCVCSSRDINHNY